MGLELELLDDEVVQFVPAGQVVLLLVVAHGGRLHVVDEVEDLVVVQGTGAHVEELEREPAADEVEVLVQRIPTALVQVVVDVVVVDVVVVDVVVVDVQIVPRGQVVVVLVVEDGHGDTAGVHVLVVVEADVVALVLWHGATNGLQLVEVEVEADEEVLEEVFDVVVWAEDELDVVVVFELWVDTELDVDVHGPPVGFTHDELELVVVVVQIAPIAHEDVVLVVEHPPTRGLQEVVETSGVRIAPEDARTEEITRNATITAGRYPGLSKNPNR